MGTFNWVGLDELELSLEELAKLPSGVQDEMLRASADVVTEAQQRKADAYGIRDTGMMIESIGSGRPGPYPDGRKIDVWPKGTRRNGKKTKRNAEIAYIAEYGREKQPARPFMRDANEECASEATEAAGAVYDAWLRSINLL